MTTHEICKDSRSKRGQVARRLGMHQIDGVKKYLYLVMDAKTRFVLTAMIVDTEEASGGRH